MVLQALGDCLCPQAPMGPEAQRALDRSKDKEADKCAEAEQSKEDKQS